MSLEVYPSTPKPSYSLMLDHQFRTLVSDFESGKEQRRKMWRFPKRTFILIYKKIAMTDSGRNAVYEFFEKKAGAYESFWYFDSEKRKFIDQYVGYGDGTTDIFDLPSKITTQYPKVYVAGVEKTRTVHWDFLSGGGEGGADRIDFTPGNIPTTGQLITTDLEGYLRIKGRFKDDKLTEELWFHNREIISISIYEVKY
jgi:hypothetical protein